MMNNKSVFFRSYFKIFNIVRTETFANAAQPMVHASSRIPPFGAQLRSVIPSDPNCRIPSSSPVLPYRTLNTFVHSTDEYLR